MELISDTRSATITYTFADGSTQAATTYNAENVGDALPTDSAAGKTFTGWQFKADGEVLGTSTTMTDDLLTKLDEVRRASKTITVEGVFTTASSGGYLPGYGGGSSSEPDDETVTEDPFTNVARGKYYYNAILWAAEKGITNGKGIGTFTPNEACNRGQMVTFLYRNELSK